MLFTENDQVRRCVLFIIIIFIAWNIGYSEFSVGLCEVIIHEVHVPHMLIMNIISISL